MDWYFLVFSLQEFFDAWCRLLADQEEQLSDRTKELMFYEKLKGSTVLRASSDFYHTLGDGQRDRSCAPEQFLIPQ